jgi:hypothetical protein
MPAAFAAAEARLGASTIARLANAQLETVAGGVAVEGILDRRPIQPDLGGSGMQARNVRFTAATAAADAADFVEGVLVTDGTDRWSIELRTPLLELGQVEFELKRAP